MGWCAEAWIRRGFALFFALPVVALAAVGWSATSGAALPSPDKLALNTVVRVSDVPRSVGTITRAEFRHALVQAAAAEGRSRAPKPGGREYERLMRTAVNSLLEAIWLKGQAAEMYIVVSRGQIKRELARIIRKSFESVAEYRKFLREARYTRSDVYERVELQLLSMRIQHRIAKRVRSRSEEEKVFDEFVTEFNRRWRGRTVCAPAYATDRCSNGPQFKGRRSMRTG